MATALLQCNFERTGDQGNGRFTVTVLRWGEGGFDPKLPHGTDVGDMLVSPRAGEGESAYA